MPDPKPSEITSRPPLVDLAPKEASTPSLVYIGRDDRLYVRSVSIVSTRAARIAGRLLHADGIIRPFRFDFNIPAGALNVQVFQLAEGYLLSATVGILSAGTDPGQSYAELGLLRGRTADLDRVQVLTSGTLDLVSPIGWPGGPMKLSTEGVGWMRQFAIGDPAAGAEWTNTFTGSIRVKIRSVRFQLVTDATVANRFPRVEFVIGATVLWRSHPHDAQIASETRDYNFALQGEYVQAVGQNEHQNFLPDMYLENGMVVRSSTVGLQAGDNYGAPQVIIEHWQTE